MIVCEIQRTNFNIWLFVQQAAVKRYYVLEIYAWGKPLL